MAKWDILDSRGNVEDRRGLAPLAGGVGMVGIVVVAAFTLLTGGDLVDVLNNLQNVGFNPQQAVDSAQFQGEDKYEVFAATVLGSANDMWYEILGEQNQNYVPPKLILFRSATQSGCGVATSSVGPHYCPLDRSIYLDETFFDEMTRLLGASGGDVAEAYVIAHEAGHHVQNLLGTIDLATDNESSIKLELQADCFAGLWAHSIKDRNVFAPGEISEAIDAAAAVGDNRVQQKTQGQINPETWTHGSSEQRMYWFNQGYQRGTLAACDTFAVPEV